MSSHDDFTEQDFDDMDYEQTVEWCASVILSGGRLEAPERTWMLYDRSADNYYKNFKRAVMRYVEARQ